MPSCYLDIYAGEQSKFEEEDAQYQLTRSLLDKHASTFGLPSLPEDLDTEQQDILGDVHKSDSQPLRFRAPMPLLLGRLIFQLDPVPGLAKTRQNFSALCTGEKGQCKSNPKKKLHYMGCPIHRIVRSFVAQGGDVTRGDGSGGESIYGPKFACEKAGLHVTPRKGSLAMANSGGKSPVSSSQFFIVLADDEKSLAKLAGKYAVFGQVVPSEDSDRILDRLNEVSRPTGSSDETPSVPVWIGSCGIQN
ncbi:cyclophilin-like domain-containing protein [Mycena metata]|uniref:peptidylprolyl isomerase n=1 Tax=Mycena metata TaxID=1033252 RepID=A0AAD7HLY2_9AGAR|nr:cyclophilin-like domain-containing protein [Mycena metata]